MSDPHSEHASRFVVPYVWGAGGRSQSHFTEAWRRHSYSGLESWIWSSGRQTRERPAWDWSVFAHDLGENSEEGTLADIARLEDHWDGEGSLAPTAEIIEATRRIITVLGKVLPRPDITPNDNGTITIEWRERSDYASLEVGATTFAFMMQFDRDKTRFENGQLDELNELTGIEIKDALYWKRPTPPVSGNGWAFKQVDA